jgi:hypothetical protein
MGDLPVRIGIYPSLGDAPVASILGPYVKALSHRLKAAPAIPPRCRVCNRERMGDRLIGMKDQLTARILPDTLGKMGS